MHCASCTGSVESGLAEVPGVLDTAVNLASGQALVRHALGQADPDALRAAVKRSGFTVLEAGRGPIRRLRPPPIRWKTADCASAGSSACRQRLPSRSACWRSGDRRSSFRGPRTCCSIPGHCWCWLRRCSSGPGWRFYRGTWLAARRATTDMNTLIAVGTSRGLRLQRRAYRLAGAAERRGWSGSSVLRSLGGHHRAGPARPVRRGRRQGAGIRRDPASPRSQVQDGPASSATVRRLKSLWKTYGMTT